MFRNQQFLFTFNFSAGSKQRATTTLDFEHVTRCLYLSLFSCGIFNPIALISFCVSHPSLQLIFVLFQTCHISSICPFFYPTVASNSYTSWDECPSNLWTLPTFSDPQNMTRDDLTSPGAAAATSQVKLCPYNEEKPHI
jgi:hypothetical protein